ncbi:MAG: polysaccharide biosynthesis protein [Bacillota bacterium]
MSRKQTFLGGAFVLALAGFFSKALGAVYRVPLYPLLGREGMGLFQMAYPAYGLVLVLSTTGINVAVSKVVAERVAAGDEPGAWRVFRLSLALLAGLGLVLSAALLIAAGPIATLVARDPRAYLSIAAVSPAIFFVSIMAAYRGLFQGLQQMTPTALSQVIEQLVRVGTMLSLAYLLRPRGVEFASAGATFGAVTGAVAGLLYMVFVYYRVRPRLRRLAGRSASSEAASRVIGRIVRLAVPVSLASGVLGTMQFLDLALVPARLRVAGFVGDQVTALYGQMSGGALPLVNMPTVLTAALQTSLVPAISEALVGGSWTRVRDRAETAIRVTFLLMLPSVVGLYVLSQEIPSLLFRDPGIGVPLAAMSAGTLFLALQQTTSGVLQGMGEMSVPVRNLLLGAVAKGIVTYTLTAMPALGIQGAALGTVVGFLVAASLNLTVVTVRLGTVIRPVDMVVKPGLAALIMGIGVRAIYDRLFAGLGSGTVATLGAIGGGMVIYGAVILLTGGIKGSDLDLIPVAGPALRRVMKKVGLMV